MRGWSRAERRTPEKRPNRKLRQKTVVREAACTRTGFGGAAGWARFVLALVLVHRVVVMVLVAQVVVLVVVWFIC